MTAVYRRNDSAPFRMRLGVIGHVPHWTDRNGRPMAFEAYIREMRIWAELFANVQICSPRGDGQPRGNIAPYCCDNICWHPVDYTVLPGKALKRAIQLPGMALAVRRAILETDFILLRSPGHFSLVGAAFVRALKRRSITKWAGENGAYQGEKMIIRIDRILQSKPNLNHQLLVYGPAKLPHHISFIPALMSDQELERAQVLSSGKQWTPPWQILSVGRLVPEKGFDLALRGLSEFTRARPNVPWKFTLIGDGPAKSDLEALALQAGIADRVTFAGPLPYHNVQEFYAAAHVVIMPGVKEGWPKVIAEAWAHGAIPVAAHGGIVPYIIRDESCGAIFEPNPSSLGRALVTLLSQSVLMQSIASHVHCHCRELSLTEFKRKLKQVLLQRCALKQNVELGLRDHIVSGIS